MDARAPIVDSHHHLWDLTANRYPWLAEPARDRGWGDWSAHIAMEFTGDPPHMDLDNLAKAMLDSAVGAAFHDDSQVARLLVERRVAEREGVWMRLAPMG